MTPYVETSIPYCALSRIKIRSGSLYPLPISVFRSFDYAQDDGFAVWAYKSVRNTAPPGGEGEVGRFLRPDRNLFRAPADEFVGGKKEHRRSTPTAIALCAVAVRQRQVRRCTQFPRDAKAKENASLYPLSPYGDYHYAFAIPSSGITQQEKRGCPRFLLRNMPAYTSRGLEVFDVERQLIEDDVQSMRARIRESDGSLADGTRSA